MHYRPMDQNVRKCIFVDMHQSATQISVRIHVVWAVFVLRQKPEIIGNPECPTKTDQTAHFFAARAFLKADFLMLG